MSDAMRIVQEFCDRMVHRDAESLRGYLADDVVYQNCGMAPTVGVDAVVANLTAQISMFPNSYEYVTKNIAFAGDAVLTERLDHIEGPDGSVHALPVMGTFIVIDGKEGGTGAAVAVLPTLDAAFRRSPHERQSRPLPMLMGEPPVYWWQKLGKMAMTVGKK